MTPSSIPSAVDPTGPVFTHVRRVRSSDDIVAQIREAILSGKLTPGSRLANERELGSTFGVSRSTLREALRTLEVLGMIEIRAGSAGGIFILEPDGDHVGSALEALLRFRGATAGELAEFRVSFESETAAWAAKRAETTDDEVLNGIAKRFVSLAEQREVPWQTLVKIDIDFHEALARASKNQVRVAIMLGIHRALYRASSSLDAQASPSLRRAIGRELELIAEAIRQRDEQLARDRMRCHVRKFSELEKHEEQKAH
jgi:GntR family transcriptional repressor for pyruvate dehydrogenase complex